MELVSVPSSCAENGHSVATDMHNTFGNDMFAREKPVKGYLSG